MKTKVKKSVAGTILAMLSLIAFYLLGILFGVVTGTFIKGVADTILFGILLVALLAGFASYSYWLGSVMTKGCKYFEESSDD